MKDDDFELSLFGDDDEPELGADELRSHPSLFDWREQDPQGLAAEDASEQGEQDTSSQNSQETPASGESTDLQAEPAAVDDGGVLPAAETDAGSPDESRFDSAAPDDAQIAADETASTEPETQTAAAYASFDDFPDMPYEEEVIEPTEFELTFQAIQQAEGEDPDGTGDIAVAPAEEETTPAEPFEVPVTKTESSTAAAEADAGTSTSAQSVIVPNARVSNGMTVLISGGDRGIGAASAKLFWQAGYHTAVLYNTNETAARNLVNALGSDCMAVHCDVADRASCEAAYRVVTRTFGSPDVLVCNAGIAQQKLFTDITEEDWNRMIGVDLTGVFHLCQLVLPGMIQKKYGRILTVSSMWGQTGGSCEVHYSAAKAGIIGLTKALAKEEAPSGITVNCVAPGIIDTDMMSTFSEEDKLVMAQETPVERLGQAEEVARTLLFLADPASGYITGQVWGVNGGLVI